MNTKQNLLATLVAMMFLVTLGAGLWIGGAYLVRLAGSGDWLSNLDSISLLSFALLLSAFVVTHSLRWAKRQEAAHQTREARRGVYESTVLAWQDALRNAQEKGGTIASRLPEDTRALEAVLALRASSIVMRHYERLCQLCSQPDPSLEQVNDQLYALIMDIRRELGVGGYGPSERTALRAILRNPWTEKDPEIQPTPPFERQPPSVVTAVRPVFSLGK